MSTYDSTDQFEDYSDHYCLDTRLTLFKLNQWYSEFHESVYSEDEVYYVFQGLSDSKVLLNNFLNYSLKLQRRVADQIAHAANAKEVSVFTDLCLEADRKLPNTHDWFTDSTDEIARYYKSDYPSVSSSSYVLSESLFFAQSHFKQYHIKPSVMKLHLSFPLIMVHLHGDEAVTKVLQTIRKNKMTVTMIETVHLIQKWSELKDYPPEWMLNMVKND